MKKVFRKLLLGNFTRVKEPEFNPIQKRIQNIKAIWNNDHQDDNGIEKLFAYSSSQLFFPEFILSIYSLKRGRIRGPCRRSLRYFKSEFPIIDFDESLAKQSFRSWSYGICNVRNNFIHSHLNFASDLFSKPRSYKRSMLLLFFNYIEMVFGFAVLYSFTNKFNKPLSHWFDSIY
jgi:hypothetical protein